MKPLKLVFTSLAIGLLIISGCGNSSQSVKEASQLVLAHNLRYYGGRTNILKVKLEFADLLNMEGQRIRQVKLPEGNKNYSLTINSTGSIHYRWLARSDYQIHVLADSLNFDSTDRNRISTSRILRQVNITDHLPLIAGRTAVNHKLMVKNPNPEPVRVQVSRLVTSSRNGRILEQRRFRLPDAIPADSSLEVIVKDRLNPDFLSETTTMVIDSVFYSL